MGSVNGILSKINEMYFFGRDNIEKVCSREICLIISLKRFGIRNKLQQESLPVNFRVKNCYVFQIL